MSGISKAAAVLAATVLAGGLAYAADDAGAYLAKSAEPNVTMVLSGYPAAGSPEMAKDEAVFKRTRALKDTPRWALAISDASKKPEDVAGDFSCAVGAKLDASTAPHLIAMIARMEKDVAGVSGPAKDKYKRARPYIGNDAPICEERTAEKPNESYPSGHTTTIWSIGLMLAHAVPDRADEILARTRVYAESRVVCGVHWLSDIEAGRVAGAVTYQSLDADPSFRADMDAVKAELAAARANPVAPDKARCEVEAAAARHSVE
jgi:acid phosphatase (class A)